ncbi:nicotinate-nucleotide adenylyltransferase [Phaeobacter sp. CAU 1743]|uniref:nicotinate-nucleotide adenylyltransferase n=1 Tax=Phaeobacter sp. CAU 1743 TaxID=3140367 RepID=UPI00325BF27A
MRIKRSMTCGFPYLRPSMRVGLLGGSFDPPHRGHVEISLAALRRFDLDRMLWLVSPGNPLKSRAPATLERRVAAARKMMQHPRIEISDIEARLGTRYTAETLRHLRARYPGVRFVWLMGADNLTHFHRWKDWREILETVPVGVLARPGDRISARLSPAAKIYGQYRLKSSQSHLLAGAETPAWCFLNVPMIDTSSTEIRARGDWSAT